MKNSALGIEKEEFGESQPWVPMKSLCLQLTGFILSQ
jgi:hypothetical protein